MKKYFIFAAIAAAGLLTSCSSDDIASNEGQIPESEDGRPAIQIGVGSAKVEASTRGTGTVGGMNAADAATDPNIWRGERVHVLMFDIKEEANNVLLPTFNFTKKNNSTTENLYDDHAILVTPLIGEKLETGLAKEPTDPTAIGDGATFHVKYYPIIGQSDFWGYYLGGYGTGDDAPAGDGSISGYTYTAPAATATNPTLTAAASTDAATVMATDFVIDGTHDLMVGNAPWADDGQYTKFRYSAKAARQNIQPNITFNHLLSRLKFKAVAGNAKADGVRVTAIKVRSKTTGEMIVAYKYQNANGLVDFDANVDGTQTPIRIAWDTDQQAMAYNNAGTPAVYAWENSDEDEFTNSQNKLALGKDVTFPDADLTLANVDKIYKQWIDANQDEIEDAGEVTYKKVVEQTPATNELPLLSLKRRITQADITAAAAAASEATYKWEASTEDAYNTAKNASADNVVDVDADYAQATHDATYLVGTYNGKIIKFNNAYKKVVEDQPAVPATLTAADLNKMKPLAPVAMEYSNGTAATYKWAESDATAFGQAGNNAISTYDNVVYASNTHDAQLLVEENYNKIFKFSDGNSGYVYKKVVVDQEGQNAGGVAKEIGEALLVAPQAKYDIFVEYQMDTYTAQEWYRNANGDPVSNLPGDYAGARGVINGVLHTDLVRTGSASTTANAGDPFEAGASYLVTITLYGPEQIEITTTLTKWEIGDQDITIGQD